MNKATASNKPSNASKVPSKPKAKAKTNTQAEPTVRATPLAFNFVRFERHVAEKSAPTGKKWRGVAPSADGVAAQPTRKRYLGFGQLFQGGNKVQTFVQLTQPSAELLRAEVGGAKLDQVCDRLAAGKVEDTKAFRQDLKALATAQKKLEAKQALKQAEDQLKSEQLVLQQGLNELENRCSTLAQAVHDRQHDMGAVRQEGQLNRRAAKKSVDKDTLADAQQTVRALEQTVRVIEKAAVASKKDLPRSPEAQAQAQAPGKAKKNSPPSLAKFGKKAAEKLLGRKKRDGAAADTPPASTTPAAALPKGASTKAIRTVDNAQLQQLIIQEAKRRDQEPEELIESWLLDDELVCAQLADDVFEALRVLYGQLQEVKIGQYRHEGEVLLGGQGLVVKECMRACDEARAKYEAAPVPL